MPATDLTPVFHFMSAGNLGGFAAKLAEAWFVADSKNRMKIELAFPELIERAREASKHCA